MSPRVVSTLVSLLKNFVHVTSWSVKLWNHIGTGADPEIFHEGWLGGWLHVLYYTELWGGGGWLALLDLFP